MDATNVVKTPVGSNILAQYVQYQLYNWRGVFLLLSSVRDVQTVCKGTLLTQRYVCIKALSRTMMTVNIVSNNSHSVCAVDIMTTSAEID